MQDLKVGILQFDQAWEDKQENISRINMHLKGKSGFDILLLPEMFHTGFTMNHEAHAEEIHNSIGIEFLQKLSSRLKCSVYTSLIIKEKDKVYNRGVLVSGEEITYYDKRKCFGMSGEDKHFTAGKKEIIKKLLGWNINLQICYDLRFPELIRNKLLDNKTAKYDVLLYIANWPKKRISHWKKLLQARAIENQCFVVGCNRTGLDGNGIEYSGNSVAVDPSGKLIEPVLKDGIQGVSITTFNYETLVSFRKKLPFLQDY